MGGRVTPRLLDVGHAAVVRVAVVLVAVAPCILVMSIATRAAEWPFLSGLLVFGHLVGIILTRWVVVRLGRDRTIAGDLAVGWWFAFWPFALLRKGRTGR